MKDIGWLFLFMSDFEHNSVLATLGSQSESSGCSEKCVAPLKLLTVEQIAAVREFFELIAKWEGKKSSHGN